MPRRLRNTLFLTESLVDFKDFTASPSSFGVCNKVTSACLASTDSGGHPLGGRQHGAAEIALELVRPYLGSWFG
jgi:hypothetical protein